MERLWGPGSRRGRCTGISPGTCRVMNREGVCVARAQVSSYRRAGDRRGQTRPREDPASSPPRAICSGVAASSCNPRLPGRVWSSVGAALRPGRAAGTGGAGEPGRPASLRGVDRLAPHGCLPPLPLASFSPNFLPVRSPSLPAISSASSAVWFLRAPFVPPEQLGSQALLGGEASAGHGRSVGWEWGNRGGGEGDTPALGRAPQAAAHALPGIRVRRDFPVRPPRSAPLPPSTCALGCPGSSGEETSLCTRGARGLTRGCFAIGGHLGLALNADDLDQSYLPSLGHGLSPLKRERVPGALRGRC